MYPMSGTISDANTDLAKMMPIIAYSVYGAL